MKTASVVAIGGALGALGRYALSLSLGSPRQARFPPPPSWRTSPEAC